MAPLLAEGLLEPKPLDRTAARPDARASYRYFVAIESLPESMDASGFPLAARLCRHWLSGLGSDVVVDWEDIAGYDRVGDALAEIESKLLSALQSGVFTYPLGETMEAKGARRRLLARAAKESLDLRVQEGRVDPIPESYVGVVPVYYNVQQNHGERRWETDDLSASLGRFGVRTYLSLTSTVSTGPTTLPEFSVDGYSVRVRDSYDFEGHQFLGLWGPKGFGDPAGELLFNSSFREFQRNTGKGRDFVVKVKPKTFPLEAARRVFMGGG